MAEIIPLRATCCADIPVEPVSPTAWLQVWFRRLVTRRRRVGNADELPDRLRRDMGLGAKPWEPGRHYSDYMTSQGLSSGNS